MGGYFFGRMFKGPKLCPKISPNKTWSGFLGGVLFGTAGISILKSKDAKKVYTHCTAAVLRGKDAVMNEAAALKENCQDIYADASDINEKRYAEEDRKKLEAARELVRQYEEKVNANEAAPAEG